MKKLVIFILFIVSIPEVSFAQENQIIHLDRNTYTYIKQLQQRGYFTTLNPTLLPYTRGQVQDGLEKIERSELSKLESYWLSLIEDEVGIDRSSTNDEMIVDVIFKSALELNNTLNDNGLRPQDLDQLYLLPVGEIQGLVEKDNFIAQMGLRHDLFYFYDNRGNLALSRYYVRSEDYYAGFQNDFVKIYLGRFDNHWGVYDEMSTILSDNPRSFDQVNITFGNAWFQLSSILGELDNLGKDGQFSDKPGRNRVDGTRRYFASHRIDVKITDGLRLGFFDGFIYSAENANPSLKFLSPVNSFFFDRDAAPDNEDYNAFFGGSIWWRLKKMTMNTQVMIDDIHVNPGPNTPEEPMTFSISSSFTFSEIFQNIDLGIETEAVAYQTYNTSVPEGNMLFLNRGLAVEYNDYLSASVFARIYPHNLLKGLTLTPRYTVLAQGEQEIKQPQVIEYPNGDVIDIILTGNEEITQRVSIEAFYNPLPEFWIRGNLGYNMISDFENILGRERNYMTGFIEAGFRIDLDKARTLFGF